ncbi:MAG: LysE family transporter [Thermoleophilia bacterium]
MRELGLIFASSLLVAYSGALMPGPMLTIVIAESPRQGVKTGPLVVLGHALLELALLVALIVGLGPVLTRPAVHATLAVVGGIMLIGTAASMFLTVARRQVDLTQSLETGTVRHVRTVAAGAVASLSNPYWVLWWATIGLSLVTQAYLLGLAGVIAFYLGHILGDLTWFTAVSGLVAAGRRWISQRLYYGMIVVSACFLVLLAGWFFVSGVRTIIAS